MQGCLEGKCLEINLLAGLNKAIRKGSNDYWNEHIFESFYEDEMVGKPKCREFDRVQRGPGSAGSTGKHTARGHRG